MTLESVKVRGNKKAKEEQLRIMTDIVNLSHKHDDCEIMNTLGIPNATYYRYKSKIYKQSKKLWEQVCKESLELRALQIKKSLDLCIKINEEIALDQNQHAKDRMEASQLIVDAQITIFRLLKDGPDVIRERKQF